MLSAASVAFAGGLDAAGIPFTPAPAGMFLWVDLRAAFGGKQATWGDEEALWNCLVKQHRVVLTPGEFPFYPQLRNLSAGV
jgi:aspartate/methionine/tyrosine aminotransferase